MEEYKEAFLKKKVYYEGCPGCKVEQLNHTEKGIPVKNFVFLWIVALCTALPVTSLFPFIYFMVRDFRIAKREEDIGYYAGYVGSSFMFGRTLTSYFWGVIADRYGRKPVLIFSTFVLVVFNTLFGLSANFWMAITMRFLLGSLNGLLGTIRALTSEICRAEHRAIGLSLVGTAWAIGLVIGPSLGGVLSQPAEKYPHIFSIDSIFGRFPYFLPCLCISIFAVVATVLIYFLPETLHIHHGMENFRYDAHEALDSFTNDNKVTEDKGPKSIENLFRNWSLMSAIILYCVFSLHDMAYTGVFSLWAVSPRKHGGLNYTTQDVGEILSISGFGLLLFQTFLYPIASNFLGPILVTRIAAVLTIPLLSSYPFIAKLSGFSLSLLINCASVFKSLLATSIVTGLVVLQNNAVEQHLRGAANGISMTGQSLFNALGPAGGGVIFSFAQKRQHASFLPGDQLVFFLLNLVELVGLLMTFKPFLTNPTSKS